MKSNDLVVDLLEEGRAGVIIDTYVNYNDDPAGVEMAVVRFGAGEEATVADRLPGEVRVSPREAAEALVRQEAQEIVGTVVTVKAATCYDDEQHTTGDFTFDPPLRVKVLPPREEDIIRWMDDGHIDPTYPVEGLEAHPSLPPGMRPFFIYGRSWNLDGTHGEPDYVELLGAPAPAPGL